MHKMMILPNGLAVLDNGDELSRCVMERGLNQDGIVSHNILPLLKEGDWVIDAGAALGDHTRPYLEKVGISGKVFAFEPCPEFFKCLQHNCPSAICFPTILWDSETDLFLNEANMNRGASFVSTERLNEYSIGPIRTTVIDNLDFKRLDFVKLDIEGSEYRALTGMRHTLRRFRPKMVIEMNPACLEKMGTNNDAVYDLLDSLGYDWDSIRNNPGKRCHFCDILAWPK